MNEEKSNLSVSEVGGAGGGWGLSHKKEIHDKVTDLWIRTLLGIRVIHVHAILILGTQFDLYLTPRSNT